jgi:predicted permease
MTNPASPPRLARALLRRAIPDEARDAIDGDLHEVHAVRHAASGSIAAATWYWLQTISIAMRFTFDRFARAIRSLTGGDARPSTLDLKLGARMLAKSPGLTLVGGFGIAVGVALGAGAYATINTYFYPELPLHEGDRIVALGKFDRRRHREDERLLHDFLVWRRELRTVVDLGAYRSIRRNLVSETGQGEPITIAEMTASGFRVPRVPPLLGRTLMEADERPGAPPVIVIGYDVWQSQFAGDQGILGRKLRIGRETHAIVGVMPEGFLFPVSHHYWIPLRFDPRVASMPGSGPDLEVFGRIAPGVTKEAAQAELTAIGRTLAAEGPQELAHLEPRIVPYTDVFVNGEAENEGPIYSLLRFLITFLLVVVAMNVAVLVYARTVTRTGEIAVRTALGATRGRIVAQLFAEAFVLSGLAALVGLGMVAVGLRMLDDFLESGGGAPFWIKSGLSLGTILYTFALAVLSAVIVGVFPALRATGAQLREAMGSLGSGTKARLGPTWTALIVVQVAIAVAILPPAIYKGSQTIHMALQPSGFAAGEYVATRFWVESEADASVDKDAERAAADSARRLMTEFVHRVATQPGVVGVTVSNGEPWAGGHNRIEVDGSDGPAERVRDLVVDSDFFGLFGVRVLAGRGFSPADGALPSLERPVVVNRSFVNELIGFGDPIGKRVRYQGFGDEVYEWQTIVGVVDDFPAGVKSSGDVSFATIYHLTVPGEWAGRGEWGSGMLTVRLRGQSPETFAPSLRRLATSIDPMLQLSGINALDGLYREFTQSGARLALVIALITGSVLFLSAAGIHALMSFTVNQRRREIGIRCALGASGRSVLTSIRGRAMRQLAIGVGVGLTIAVALDTFTGGEMMGGTGLLLVPATAAFMLAVGLLAATGPARRGLRVQPTEALRAE